MEIPCFPYKLNSPEKSFLNFPVLFFSPLGGARVFCFPFLWLWPQRRRWFDSRPRWPDPRSAENVLQSCLQTNSVMNASSNYLKNQCHQWWFSSRKIGRFYLWEQTLGDIQNLKMLSKSQNSTNKKFPSKFQQQMEEWRKIFLFRSQFVLDIYFHF